MHTLHVLFMSCAALIGSIWLNWMLSLVFAYVFWFGLLVFMSCVNYIIEKRRLSKKQEKFLITLSHFHKVECKWKDKSDYLVQQAI